MSIDQVLQRIDDHREDAIEGLLEYLRIPSVSTDPAYADDVRRCAELVRSRLEGAGVEAKLIETAGHPLVWGERIEDPELPTVLFYGHYDVQPPEPLEEWRNPPFEPTLEPGPLPGGRIVARGATDDKGQSFAHILAVEHMLAVDGSLPVNVKFLIEGEEESGGEAIEHFVRDSANLESLGCDCVVVSDSSMYAPGQPSILYGLKGLLYCEIRLHGPDRDLHSGSCLPGLNREPGFGSFYSGWRKLRLLCHRFVVCDSRHFWLF